jgi:hypothetical protein
MYLILWYFTKYVCLTSSHNSNVSTHNYVTQFHILTQCLCSCAHFATIHIKYLTTFHRFLTLHHISSQISYTIHRLPQLPQILSNFSLTVSYSVTVLTSVVDTGPDPKLFAGSGSGSVSQGCGFGSGSGSETKLEPYN